MSSEHAFWKVGECGCVCKLAWSLGIHKKLVEQNKLLN